MVDDALLSPTQLESGKPTKSSETFVIGRSHEFVESDVKFRIPPVCAYCSVIIQRTVSHVQMHQYNIVQCLEIVYPVTWNLGKQLINEAVQCPFVPALVYI